MGAMKRINYEMRVLGRRLTSAEELLYGLREPRPSKEELQARREAGREAAAERAAIQALAREEEAEELARRPRAFAPDAPDFPRSRRPGPPDWSTPRPPPADVEGLACPLAHASAARASRRFVELAAAGLLPPGVARLRREMGPPKPPPKNTGYYELGDGSFCRVGTAPFAEYRYPGLAWRLHWTMPKPDDAPWEDEAPAVVVDQVAAEPEAPPPRRRSRSKADPAQAVFAW